MEDWKELMEGRVFITDLGREETVRVEGKEETLARYAVWSPMRGSEGHTVVEVGSDLESLMGRYEVSLERVCVLMRE